MNSEYLENLFQKAIDMFNQWIKNADDDLRDQLDFELEKIVPEYNYIKITPSNTGNLKQFEVEIHLKLINPQNEPFGSYRLIEDESRNFIDEFLVWD